MEAYVFVFLERKILETGSSEYVISSLYSGLDEDPAPIGDGVGW